MISPRSNFAAFTLLEMTIVLVIIGLLVGGVLVGRDMIRTSQVNAVIDEYKSFNIAVSAFRDQYHALPGDFKHATEIWGQDSGTNSRCATGTYSGTPGKTCDGTGDGYLNTGSPSASQERYQFWNQLALAQLIAGNYTGYATANGPSGDSNPGVNVPRSKLSGAGWSVIGLGPRKGDAQWFDASYWNIFFFGARAVGWDIVNGILTPLEAHNIDLKLDDGLPAEGSILSRRDHGNTGGTRCSNNNPADTGPDATPPYQYSANNRQACIAIFKLNSI